MKKTEGATNEAMDVTSNPETAARPDVVTSIPSSAVPIEATPSTITSSANDAASGSNRRQQDQTIVSAVLGGVNNNNNNNNRRHNLPDGVYSSSDDDDDDDEYDEIVREIDVYISPELAKTMNLIQFPLHIASHSNIPTTNTKDAPQQRHPPIPTAARLKPEHSLLELDYAVPTYSFSTQRSVPEVLDLSNRTHTSSEIPITTHMALGIFDNTGTKIDLVPLHRVLQMRPSFQHIDAVFDDDDLLAKQSSTADGKKKDNPILFKKSESERTVQIRESSYAFKRASEEKEEWLTLDVHGPRSVQTRDAMRKVSCPKEGRNVDLKFVKPGKIGGGTGYVKSLNYLPNVNFEEDAEEDFIKPPTVGKKGATIAGGDDSDDDNDDDKDDVPMEQDGEEEETESMFQKELTDRVAKLLQGRGGVPIPYPVIRSRYHHSIPDSDLIHAISASAVLVRGNFLLKSSLLGLTSPHVANARDLILILLNKYGFVQRDKLMAVYQALDERDDIAKVIVTRHILSALCDLVGRKTVNGVELKVDDDPTMEADFGDVVRMHDAYWRRKEDLLLEYVGLYEDQM